MSWECTSLPTASKFCWDSEEPAGVDHKMIWWFNVEGAQRSVRLMGWERSGGDLLASVGGTHGKRESAEIPNG